MQHTHYANLNVRTCHLDADRLDAVMMKFHLDTHLAPLFLDDGLGHNSFFCIIFAVLAAHFYSGPMGARIISKCFEIDDGH